MAARHAREGEDGEADGVTDGEHGKGSERSAKVEGGKRVSCYKGCVEGKEKKDHIPGVKRP